MRIHTGGQAPLAVAAHGVGSHGQHRQLSPTRIGADLLGGGQAIHHRHLHIHQHQLVIVHGQHIQGDLTIFGHGNADPGGLQQITADLLVQLVIIHQQHLGALQRAEVLHADVTGRAQAALTGAAAAKSANRRVEQQRRAHRLDQQQGNPGLLSLMEDFFAAISRNDHRLRRGSSKASWRQVSRPLMPGIFQSTKAASKGVPAAQALAASSSACSPQSASAT